MAATLKCDAMESSVGAMSHNDTEGATVWLSQANNKYSVQFAMSFRKAFQQPRLQWYQERHRKLRQAREASPIYEASLSHFEN